MLLKSSKTNSIFFLLFITVFIYLPTLENDFIYTFDDGPYVVDNKNVNSGVTLGNVIWAFTNFHSGNWHPLTWISHMIDCQFFGLNPLWHHLISLLWHAINTTLIYCLFFTATKNMWRSFSVALLFAIHPLHVESVAWIAERKDLLSTFFLLITIYQYCRFRVYKHLKNVILSLVFFCCGLMSKPMVVTIPLLLILIDFWPLRARITNRLNSGATWKQRLTIWLNHHKELVVYFLFSFVSSFITYFSQQSSNAVADFQEWPLFLRLKNVIYSYALYLLKTIVPQKLSVFYPYDDISLLAVIVSLISLSLITFIAIKKRKAHPWFLWGWLWYIIALLPVIGIVRAGAQLIADRYTYIPSIGLFVIVVWEISIVVQRWQRLKMPLLFFSFLYILYLGILTQKRTEVWKNEKTLFTNALNNTQRNYLAYSQIAYQSLEEKRFSDAEEFFKKAIAIQPDYVGAILGYGIVSAKKKKFEKARSLFNRCIKINKNAEEVNFNLGLTYYEEGIIDSALFYLKKEANYYPDNDKPLNAIGSIYYRSIQLDSSYYYFRKALAANPVSAQSYQMIGKIFILNNEIDNAIKALKRYHALQPKDGAAFFETGKYLEKHGEFKHAIYFYKKAVELAPLNNTYAQRLKRLLDITPK